MFHKSCMKQVVRVLNIAIGLILLLSIAFTPTRVSAATTTVDDQINPYNVSWVNPNLWYHYNSSVFSTAMNGTVSMASDPQALVSWKFYGSKVTLFYTMAYNRGSAYISIDGNIVDILNQNGPGVRRQVGKTWNVPNNDGSQHTLSVSPVGPAGGNGIEVDAFASDIQTYGTGVYNDEGSEGRKIGTWQYQTNSLGRQGGYSYTTQFKDLARLTFVGRAVTIFYTGAPDGGISNVTIDGVDKQSIDMSCPYVDAQRTSTFAGLGSGTHIINISLQSTDGKKLYFDGFAVAEGVYNRSSAVSYADRWALDFNRNVYPVYTADNINFLSQVLQNGGLPETATWYVGSEAWYKTPSFYEHVVTEFGTRYWHVSNVNELELGDFFLVDDPAEPGNPNFGRIYVGTGNSTDGSGYGRLVDQHSYPRYRVMWNYLLVPTMNLTFFRVIY